MIIFVTAYDQYALKAFDSLALDYLLKPVRLSQLQKSVSKLEKFERAFHNPGKDFSDNQLQANPLTSSMKRFVIKQGRKWSIIEEKDVDMFFAEEKYCYLRSNGIDNIVNLTLQELEAKLDPAVFIRIHRSTIIAFRSIRSFKSLGSGRFEVELADGSRVVSSRYYSHRLKQYLTGSPV